jgi:tetratricopeptide (TPR) repeat protein
MIIARRKYTDNRTALLALKSIGVLLILGGGIWFFMLFSDSGKQSQGEVDKRWEELQRMATILHKQYQRQTVEQTINQVQQYLDKDDLQQSRALIDKGLQLEPKHPQLLELRNIVEERLTLTQQAKTTDEHQRLVAELLTQAEQHWLAKRQLTPPENNVHEIYQKILALEPDNSQAKAGLVRLANSFEQAAQQRLQAEAMKESMNFIDAGLTIDPNHAGLHELRGIVEAHQAELEKKATREKRDQKKFKKALANAKHSQASGALKQSLTHIKQGLKIYPRHTELLNLRKKVRIELAQNKRQTLKVESQQQDIAALLAQAMRSKSAGALKESLSYVVEALQINPQHGVLQELQADLKTRLAEQKRQIEARQHRRQEVETLLSRAEQGKRQGALTDSLGYIQQGLQISPNHNRLLELQTEVLAQQRLEQQRLERIDTAKHSTQNKKTEKPKKPRVFGTF